MTVIHGDCLDVMPTLNAASVDLVLADLPYGTTQCRWDAVIPFAPLWEQYRRLLKPNGAVVLTASQPFTSALVMSNPKWFKYEWIWEKSSGTNGLNAKRQPVRYHESVLVFYAQQPIYNPQRAPRKDTAKGRVASGITTGCGRTSSHYPNVADMPKRFYDVDTVYPKSVLYFDSVPNGGGGKLHPTQKPVALMEYMVRTYTNPGALVLDNTCGSGTTGVACVNIGRHFIGIEREAAYVEIARKRIADASAQLTMEVA